MLKNRLIFTLLYQNQNFMLSRNFRLQKVGDMKWIKESFDYDAIAHSIDELVILNVETNKDNIDFFCDNLKNITKQYFMPISAGGGIRSIEDAYKIIDCGVDKLVVNSILFSNPDLVRELIKIFGSQCIIASIDYKIIEGKTSVLFNNANSETGYNLESACKYVEELGVGEIYLTSINHDGTGEGFDWENISKIVSYVSIPVIASGGGGRFDHFVQAFKDCKVSGASTADLFNFMGDGLSECRKEIISNGIPMAKWDLDFFKKYNKLNDQ